MPRASEQPIDVPDAFTLESVVQDRGGRRVVAGRQGVSRILEPAMSADERQALHESAEVLRRAGQRLLV